MTPRDNRRAGVQLAPGIIADIKAAHARGVPVSVIAKELGVSTTTVYSHTAGVRRVPCPRCATPMAVHSNVCRKCNDARAGWAQQRPPLSKGVPPNGAAPLYWQCAPSPTGAHHWIIDQAALGICDHCHAVRKFSLYLSPAQEAALA